MKRSKNFGDIIIDFFIILFYISITLDLIFLVLFLVDYMGLIPYKFHHFINFLYSRVYIFGILSEVCLLSGVFCFFISLYNRSSNYLDENIKNSILMIVVSLISLFFLIF